MQHDRTTDCHGEWRNYDLLAKYEVIQRSLLRFVSDPGVSDGAKRRLVQLDEGILQAVTEAVTAAEQGDDEALYRSLLVAAPLVEVQEYVLSLNKEVDRQFTQEFFPPL